MAMVPSRQVAKIGLPCDVSTPPANQDTAERNRAGLIIPSRVFASHIRLSQ